MKAKRFIPLLLGIMALICFCLTACGGHTHSYIMDHDDTQHWKVCTGCNDKKEVEPHEFGDDNICDKCKYEGEAQSAHEHVKLTHHNEVPATCIKAGTKEYWECTCKKFFADEDGETEITDLTIPALGHNMEHNEGTPATCTLDGIKENWHCSICGKDFADENGETEIEGGLSIPAGHDLEFRAETAAACFEDGYKNHYFCTKCEKIFADKNAKIEYDKASVTIPATGHNLEYNEEVAANCMSTGVKLHWRCLNCEKIYADPNGATELDEFITPIAPENHPYEFTWNDDEHWLAPTCNHDLEIKNKAKHNYVGVGCNQCGLQLGTPGLVYSLNADKQSYTVTGGSPVDNTVIIPSLYDGLPVTAIGDKAFYKSFGIFSLSLGKNVESIGKEAFYSAGLEELTIPGNVKTIGDSAFEYCSDMESLTIEYGVETIGNKAFYNIDNRYASTRFLTTVTIPGSVKSIGSNAFGKILRLRTVIIEEGVEEIGGSAFSGSSDLRDCTIPKSIKIIGGNIFSGCPISYIIYNGSQTDWKSITLDPNWKGSSGQMTIRCSDTTITA